MPFAWVKLASTGEVWGERNEEREVGEGGITKESDEHVKDASRRTECVSDPARLAKLAALTSHGACVRAVSLAPPQIHDVCILTQYPWDLPVHYLGSTLRAELCIPVLPSCIPMYPTQDFIGQPAAAWL
jgi:hypothetical protein